MAVCIKLTRRLSEKEIFKLEMMGFEDVQKTQTGFISMHSNFMLVDFPSEAAEFESRQAAETWIENANKFIYSDEDGIETFEVVEV